MSTNPKSTGNQDIRSERPNKQASTVVINCDGSYHSRENLAAIGYIIKTNRGGVLEKHHSESSPAETSAETEANACLTAVRAAQKYSPSHLILYSDCNSVIKKIKNEYPDSQQEIYCLIRNELSHINHVSIKPTSRDRNQEAHDLAHLSLRKLRDRELY